MLYIIKLQRYTECTFSFNYLFGFSTKLLIEGCINTFCLLDFNALRYQRGRGIGWICDISPAYSRHETYQTIQLAFTNGNRQSDAGRASTHQLWTLYPWLMLFSAEVSFKVDIKFPSKCMHLSYSYPLICVCLENTDVHKGSNPHRPI